MNVRPLLLAASTVALFISACSQAPADLDGPTLEPQFGSADDDIGIDVAFASTGRIYSLSEQFGTTYEDSGDGTSYESGSYEETLLRRYDSLGKLTWTKEVASSTCNYDYYGCTSLSTRALQADSQGNSYALITYSFSGAQDCADTVNAYVYKYDASGSRIKTVYIGVNGETYGDNAGPEFVDAVDIAVDGGGNIYVARQSAEFENDYCEATRSNVVAKYSASGTGTLQWQRISTVGTPKGVTVSSSGSVYVAGSTGLARYSSSGSLTWTKPGTFEEVIVSGSSLYTRYRKDVRKFDGTGKQLWLKTQTGLATMVFQDMTGDSSGNVYLSGKYSAGGGNFNAMTRKLNSSGTVLFTKTYGTSAYDDARGIATLNGSEIYVTGGTQGALAHANIGGRDGYLRRLNSSGNPVWTR